MPGQTEPATAVEPIQTATADFFAPIACAYLAVCLTWLILKAVAGKHWRDEPLVETRRPWLDFLMIFVAIAGTFGLGSAYRHDLLLPDFSGPWSNLSSMINLCIPYLPIFVVLAVRRQSLETIWISHRSLHWKIGTGLVASAAGLLVFLGMRNEWQRMPAILAALFQAKPWVHAPAVFLEAVAVAFVFVRLRWVASPAIALAIPSLLFALGHVPGAIASERTTFEIISFLIFNTALAAAIFSVVMKSRDVIWIAIPHFLLDIAIGVFD